MAQNSEARESAGISGATQVTGISMPRPDLTPGAIRTTDASELCAKSFRTKKYRIATEETKKKVCANYGVKDCPHQGEMELDDLQALENGGENIESNLWVQPAPDFHWKDRLETKLHKMACTPPLEHLITFVQIQEAMHDWPAAYEKYIGPLPIQPQNSFTIQAPTQGQETYIIATSPTSVSPPQPTWVPDPAAGHFDCPDGWIAYERSEPIKFNPQVSMPAIYTQPSLDAKGHILNQNMRRAICVAE